MVFRGSGLPERLFRSLRIKFNEGDIVKRRDFITATTAGVALCSSGGLRAADGKMFVSLNGSLVGSKTGADGKRTPSVSWPEFARLGARVGYPGVDVNINAAMEEGEDSTR